MCEIREEFSQQIRALVLFISRCLWYSINEYNEVDNMVKTNKEIRRKQREEVIQKLYEIDINDGVNETEIKDPYVKTSVEGVLSHRDFIDRKIQDNLTNWSLSRLTYIDRAIIRFATYEMVYSQLPSEIIINEALVLTRKYSDEGNDKMVGFTNKVLDNIHHAIK